MKITHAKGLFNANKDFENFKLFIVFNAEEHKRKNTNGAFQALSLTHRMQSTKYEAVLQCDHKK